MRKTLFLIALLSFLAPAWAQVSVGQQKDERNGDKTDVSASEEEQIFVFVEQRPVFPGGDQALYKYLSQNIVYPQKARENGISGRVVISFVVEKDGTVSNAKVLHDIGGGCGEEGLRIVNSMPKWVPGKQGGKPVRCQFNLPISFSLN